MGTLIGHGMPIPSPSPLFPLYHVQAHGVWCTAPQRRTAKGCDDRWQIQLEEADRAVVARCEARPWL